VLVTIYLGQNMVSFQQAYDNVAARYSGEVWVSLDPKRIVDEIYQELRHMDAQHGGQVNGQLDTIMNDSGENERSSQHL
jgi:hypothetical protein